ncbi:hypothetical protein JW948_03100 [bacterium]|nr:hypothetical protein [bacterium]
MVRCIPGTTLFLTLFLLVSIPIGASVYYVDQAYPGAADTNSGQETAPWKTIQKACDTAVAGDTVWIKNGLYNERVTVQHSGTEQNPIVFSGYPAHAPVLDGTGLAGWWGILSIYAKDWIEVHNLEICNNTTGWGVLIEHSGTEDASHIDLSQLDVHHTAGECIQVRGDAHHIRITDCLVHNGLGPYSGIDIYRWDDGRPHHVTVESCTATLFDNGYPGAGIGSEVADDLVVVGNTIYDSKIGIDIGSGDRNLISDNLIYDCETGIALSSNEDSEVCCNRIHDIIDEGFYSYYWSANGEAHARNTWHDNIVENIGWGFYESNIKGSSGSEGPTRDHFYYNNLLTGIRRGFYFKGTTDLKFYNNTLIMDHGFHAIQLVDGAVNADIRNNIFSVSGTVDVIAIDGTSGTGAVIDWNCYDNRSGSPAGPGANSIAADPLFVSSGSDDFHLQAISPCINAGMDFSACFVHDLDTLPRPIGSGWDMGCYEFASPYVTVSVKVWLEGAYGEGLLHAALNDAACLPLTAPYSEDPRSVSQIPYGMTDWVLIQLQDAVDGPPLVSKSVFLRQDGMCVSDDGQTASIVLDVPAGTYYIVIRHRNHLSVMSGTPVSLTPTVTEY